MRDVTTASPFPSEISNLAAARATAADKAPADHIQADHIQADHSQAGHSRADRWLEIDGWLDRALEDSFLASDPAAGNCCD